MPNQPLQHPIIGPDGKITVPWLNYLKNISSVAESEDTAFTNILHRIEELETQIHRTNSLEAKLYDIEVLSLISDQKVNHLAKQNALTTQLTTITHTEPGTPDYAVQDFVDVSLGAGWAFKDHDEANSVLKTLANLQTRVSEIEDRLQQINAIG